MSILRSAKVRHPDWLKVSRPQSCIDLFNRGLLPDNIAVWMIVTGLKHPLRAVYGSDLRAALVLLWEAVTVKPRHWILTLRYRDEAMAEDTTHAEVGAKVSK
jgi:hypothetical protein